MNNFFISIDIPLKKNINFYEKNIHESAIKNRKIRSEYFVKDSILIISNSRILNGYEICSDLNILPKNDNELIFHIYNKDIKLFEKINGAFSFVLIDFKKLQVIAASDYYHQRPLYYSKNNKRYIFATNIDFILNKNEVDGSIDRECIYDYLITGMPMKGKTIYKNIKILPNNCIMKINSKKSKITKMSELSMNNRIENDSISKIKNILIDTMKKQLSFTNNKVAFSLSGGLDSGSVVSIANKISKDKQLYTYSYLYAGLDKDQRIRSNEKKFMNSVIKNSNVIPKFFTFKNHGSLNIINELTDFNEPVIGVNLYANIAVFKDLKKKKIRHLFEGMGGDNTISHGTALFYELGKSLKVFKLFREYKQYCDRRNISFGYLKCIKDYILLPYFPIISKIKNIFFNSNPTDYFNINIFLKDDKQFNISKRFKKVVGYYRKNINFYSHKVSELENIGANDGFEAYSNRLNFLIANRYNVESFDPFYNKMTKSFCMNVPQNMKMSNGIDRYYFREAMKDIIPQAIYERVWKGDMSGVFINELCTMDLNKIEELLFKKDHFFNELIDRRKLKYLYKRMRENKDIKIGLILFKLVYMSLWLKKRNFK